ncbi:MAG: hypothetical protein H7178_04510 [Chitinophagaceae bacterium]|nr:hypothetical protein [Chitinophagaceae bacterium]
MKKLFLLAAIAMVTMTASAQIKIKGIDPKVAKAKASAALKSKKANKGMSSTFTSADDCGAFTKTETAKDGSTSQSAKEFLIVSNDGATGFGFTMYSIMLEGSKYIVITGVVLDKEVCVAKGSSKMVVTFEDGEQLTLNNLNKDNCEGVVQAIIGKKLDNEVAGEQLKTKKVRSIKIVGVEKTVVKSLSENNQIQLQGTIKCL